MSVWKADFKAGEQFKIKGHVFQLANIGKRSLVMRIKPAKPEEKKNGKNEN